MNTTIDTVITHLDSTGGQRTPNKGSAMQPAITTCSRRGITTSALRAAVRSLGATMEQCNRTVTRYDGVKVHWLVYHTGWVVGISGR